jgi:hypothetical protein
MTTSKDHGADVNDNEPNDYERDDRDQYTNPKLTHR